MAVSARDKVGVDLVSGNWGTVCPCCTLPLSFGKDMCCTGRTLALPASVPGGRAPRKKLSFRCLSLLLEVDGTSFSFLLRFVMDTALERAVSFASSPGPFEGRRRKGLVHTDSACAKVHRNLLVFYTVAPTSHVALA